MSDYQYEDERWRAANSAAEEAAYWRWRARGGQKLYVPDPIIEHDDCGHCGGLESVPDDEPCARCGLSNDGSPAHGEAPGAPNRR
jgi:hypothetical protein